MESSSKGTFYSIYKTGFAFENYIPQLRQYDRVSERGFTSKQRKKVILYGRTVR